jgi:hypothetical protein
MRTLDGTRYLVRLLAELGNQVPSWWNFRRSPTTPEHEKDVSGGSASPTFGPTSRDYSSPPETRLTSEGGSPKGT